MGTNGSVTQTPCGLGTWNNMTGQAACTPASPGHYVDTNGSTSQTPCGLGTWNNMTGQAACTPASPGYYVDTNGSTSQTPCDAGTYNPNSSSNSSTDCLDTVSYTHLTLPTTPYV